MRSFSNQILITYGRIAEPFNWSLLGRLTNDGLKKINGKISELRKEYLMRRKILAKRSDKVKSFHYGVITHSEAGKYVMNQYFGHCVHLYAGIILWNYLLSILISASLNNELDFETLKT